MKCGVVQELILTDFSDHESSADVRAEITGHLQMCGSCRAFESRLRTQVLRPFEQVAIMKAPADLWMRIHDRLQQEAVPVSWYQSFLPVRYFHQKIFLRGLLSS